MKILTLALVFAVLSVVKPMFAHSETNDVQAAGKRFIDLLARRDFDGAFAQFDEKMKSALPLTKLRETWDNFQKQAGRFEKQTRSQAEKYGTYDIALVTCKFEHTPLDAKVVFDAQGQVAGLFFSPSKPPPGPDRLPFYAKTNAFSEKEVKVGRGEWILPGTLTLPNEGGAHLPAVVLVHGSGPNDRDETIGPNKPFRDIAWGLATKGIAVLRYEKRTKEHGQKFLAAGGITVKEETIDDAVLAVAELRTTDRIDPKRVFVLGHSLGGMIAPRIGQADPVPTGLIIMAGATRPLEDLILEQTRYILSLDNEKSPEAEKKLAEMEADVQKVKKLTAADSSSTNLVLGAPAKYWLDLRSYDPPMVAKTLGLPMLILQGERDYQVSMADFDRWKKALTSAPKVTFKLYPKLNHLFIAGQGKSKPAEYEIAGHVSEEVIQDMAAWIRSLAETTK
jgi:dienelactone hydrolase